MSNSAQISDLRDQDFHYLTAITKPHIEALLQADLLQESMFDEDLVEVTAEEVRYIVRRNPQRAEELAAVRQSKQARLEKYLVQKNTYLAEHPHAKVETAFQHAHAKAAHLKIQAWATLTVEGRKLALAVDANAQRAAARLDGCSVLKTALPPDLASPETAHARYQGLAEVE